MPSGGTRFLALLGVIAAVLLVAAGRGQRRQRQTRSAAGRDARARALSAPGRRHQRAVDAGAPCAPSSPSTAWRPTASPDRRRERPSASAASRRSAIGRCTQGQRGWDVAALQFLLHERGFEPGGFDGGFGPNTENAVRRFQGAARIGVDGVAGPATLNALRGNRVVRHRTARSARSASSDRCRARSATASAGSRRGAGTPGSTSRSRRERRSTRAASASSPSPASTPAATATSS